MLFFFFFNMLAYLLFLLFNGFACVLVFSKIGVSQDRSSSFFGFVSGFLGIFKMFSGFSGVFKVILWFCFTHVICSS